MKEEKKFQNRNINYTILEYVLFFFAFSFIGWIWEVGLCLVQSGELVNRGTLFGPWLPIYGTGGVLVLMFFRKFYNRPILTFFLSMMVCSFVEYFASWYLELTKGIRWWDYSGFLINLNGRICLEGSIIFGIAGCLVIYFIAPFLKKRLSQFPKVFLIIFSVLFTFLFAVDMINSHFHPNVGKGVTIDEVKP